MNSKYFLYTCKSYFTSFYIQLFRLLLDIFIVKDTVNVPSGKITKVAANCHRFQSCLKFYFFPPLLPFCDQAILQIIRYQLLLEMDPSSRKMIFFSHFFPILILKIKMEQPFFRFAGMKCRTDF